MRWGQAIQPPAVAHMDYVYPSMASCLVVGDQQQVLQQSAEVCRAKPVPDLPAMQPPPSRRAAALLLRQGRLGS